MLPPPPPIPSFLRSRPPHTNAPIQSRCPRRTVHSSPPDGVRRPWLVDGRTMETCYPRPPRPGLQSQHESLYGYPCYRDSCLTHHWRVLLVLLYSPSRVIAASGVVCRVGYRFPRVSFETIGFNCIIFFYYIYLA